MQILFSHRVINIWNSFSAKIDFTDIGSFKRSLAAFELSVYCDCLS